MEKISSKKLAEILDCSSELVDVEVSDVVTDSRIAKKGDLFIAVKGENFDAHDFVSQVIEKGVELVVVERFIDNVPANRQIVVASTLDASLSSSKPLSVPLKRLSSLSISAFFCESARAVIDKSITNAKTKLINFFILIQSPATV